MHKTMCNRCAAALVAVCLAFTLLPGLALTAQADGGEVVLTVIFNDDGTGGIDDEMLTAVKTALQKLGAPAKNTVTTLKLVGIADRITAYNAIYLNTLPMSGGWDALNKVDLSGMSALRKFGQEGMNVTMLNTNRRIKEVILPDSLQVLGKGGFGGWKALTTINLPAGLRSIGKNAFESCEALTSITLPAGLESIGNSAFADCAGLSSVTFLGKDAPSLAGSVFAGVSGATFHIPANGRGYTGTDASSVWQALSAQIQTYAPPEGWLTGIQDGGIHLQNTDLTVTFHPGEKDVSGISYRAGDRLLTAPTRWTIGPNASETTDSGTFSAAPYTITFPAGRLPLGSQLLTLEFDTWEEYNGTVWQIKAATPDDPYKLKIEFVVTATRPPSPTYSASAPGLTDYTVTAIAGPGGTISPLGETVVPYGENLTLTVTAEPGYEVSRVVVDGEKEVELTNGTYTFREVREPYTIHAEFRMVPVRPEKITPSPQTGTAEPLAVLPFGLSLAALALLALRKRLRR